MFLNNKAKQIRRLLSSISKVGIALRLRRASLSLSLSVSLSLPPFVKQHEIWSMSSVVCWRLTVIDADNADYSKPRLKIKQNKTKTPLTLSAGHSIVALG